MRNGDRRFGGRRGKEVALEAIPPEDVDADGCREPVGSAVGDPRGQISEIASQYARQVVGSEDDVTGGPGSWWTERMGLSN